MVWEGAWQRELQNDKKGYGPDCSYLLLEASIKEALSLLLPLPAALPESDVADERDSRRVSMA